MTIVSKSSAFPKTVKPGIPKLGICPKGWIRAPLRNFLHEERRPITMGDDQTYRLLTVKRARGGVVERERLRGCDISVKTQFRVQSGDFLISKRQIVHGACGLVPSDLDGSIVSNEYSVLRGNSKIDLRYLNYLAHSDYFQQTCFHSSIGVHIEKMLFDLDGWLDWDFDLPPLSEQVRIADILATWDDAVSSVDQLVKQSETQKRALFQALLTGNRRLGGSRGDWKTLPFDKFASLSKEKIDPKAIPTDCLCIELEHIEAQTGRLLGSCSAMQQESLKSVFKAGDVLFGKLRPYLRKAAFPSFAGVCSTEIWVFRADSKVCLPRYLFYLVQSEPFLKAANVSAGSKMPRAEWQIVKDALFRIPNPKEQEAVVQILDTAESLVNNYKSKLGYLRDERRALLQELLSGKRRVALEEKAA